MGTFDRGSDEYDEARGDFRSSRSQFRGNSRRRRELLKRMRGGGRGGMGWGFMQGWGRGGWGGGRGRSDW